MPRNAARTADASRRSDLLCAAARLMRKKGYAATTIREMARAVAMGSGSPFCHFRTKEEILAAIVQEGMELALAQAETLRTRRMHARRRLHALMRLHAELLHGEDRDFSAVALREWRALSPERRRHVADQMERYESIWRECLQPLVDARRLDADAALAARLLLGSLNWSVHWFGEHGAIDAHGLADATAALFVAVPAGAAQDQPSARRTARRTSAA